jgi:hypothetical protein
LSSQSSVAMHQTRPVDRGQLWLFVWTAGAVVQSGLAVAHQPSNCVTLGVWSCRLASLGGAPQPTSVRSIECVSTARLPIWIVALTFAARKANFWICISRLSSLPNKEWPQSSQPPVQVVTSNLAWSERSARLRASNSLHKKDVLSPGCYHFSSFRHNFDKPPGWPVIFECELKGEQSCKKDSNTWNRSAHELITTSRKR